MRLTFNRRQTLALGAGVAAGAMFGAAPALAKNDADEAIKKFTGGKVPVQGKVSSTSSRSRKTATPYR
jgi:sulfur-oxidizing protein SoxY